MVSGRNKVHNERREVGLASEMCAYVAYYRVSTQKQGASGLGLEAQQAAVGRFLRDGDTIIASFKEVESGKRNNRHELTRALKLCRLHRATMIIANLSRLSRNVAFLASLLEGDIAIVACDMPSADRTMLQFMSVIAEHESRACSARTKAALAQARQRGVQLGGWKGRHFTAQDRANAKAALRTQANERSSALAPVLAELRSLGIATTPAIAAELNQRAIPTPRGGRWHAASVARLVHRLV